MGANDLTGACGCCGGVIEQSRCDATLPDVPECGINYHFGMLLGTDDFRTEQGFHLGHHRRHQRLLHGFGVVNGLDVDFKDGQVRVHAGYAIDGHGRDICIDQDQCVDLVAWWQAHKEDDYFSAGAAATTPPKFDADVVLCARACLSRPVPAIADPCAPGATEMSYSRICEAFELTLVPRDPAQPATPPVRNGDEPHAIVRRLMAASSRKRGRSVNATGWRGALARAAVQLATPGCNDASNLEDDCLVIARVRGIDIHAGADKLEATVDGCSIGERRTLLSTSVLQDLLLGGPTQGSSSGVGAGPVLAAGGAVAHASSVELTFDKALAAASVTADAFRVSEFRTTTGWAFIDIADASYEDVPRKVTLTLRRAPTAQARIRLAIRGSGPTPLLGADLVPYAAATADGDGVDQFITI